MSSQRAAPEPTLLVVGGRWGGRRLAVPPGTTVVGRDPSCGIVLDVEGVSRRHARLVRTGDTVTIEDAGSTNGTSVNGEAAAGPHELHHGDRVTLGSLELSYLGPRERPVPGVVHRRGRVRIGRAVVVGALVNLLLLGVVVVVQLTTGLTGVAPWIAAPLTGMAAALVQLTKDAVTRVPEPPPMPTGEVPGAVVSPLGQGAPSADARPAPTGSHATAPMGFEVPRRSRGLPVYVAAIVTVLVLGVGGVAVAFGVATLTGLVTGDPTAPPTEP
ncbi:FHA domain-containing protein [Agromyces sp. SYSU T00266]|uniref:FHA domain-containing protein n=1 Tax=Agromyces zhanjiangensis TaxID=3158562 RepID=UPI0033983506